MSDISKTTINLPVDLKKELKKIAIDEDTVDLKKELKKIAIDEDTSLSGLILKMIEEGMNSRKKSNVFSDED